MLRGRVTGMGPDEAADVALDVRGAARFAWPEDVVARGVPEADGSFAIDVTHLFRTARDRLPLRALVVRADHPRHVEMHAPVD